MSNSTIIDHIIAMAKREVIMTTVADSTTLRGRQQFRRLLGIAMNAARQEERMRIVRAIESWETPS